MNKLISGLFALTLLGTNLLMPIAGRVSADVTNLVPNPSVEIASGNLPSSWSSSKQGTNTATFSYLNTGHTGSRSLDINMTQRSSGNARWSFAPVSVTPNTTYTYSDWYKSDVTTYIQPIVTRTSGSTQNMSQYSVPSSADWRQSNISFKTPSNAKFVTIYHFIRSVGKITTDDFMLSPPVTTPPPTAPAVQITSPASGATVTGTQVISANATDAQGISGVQFKIDGSNLGTADTSAPYSTNWDTTTSANAGHVLSAVATNTAGLSTTSSAVNVTVNNVATPPPPPPVDEENLLANSSFESESTGQPVDWLKNAWGTNTSQFIYENTGRTGNRSVSTTITQFTSGDAKWYANPVSVVAGKTYIYRDYFKSNVNTRVVVAFIDSAGNYSYQEVVGATASSSWKLYETTFVVPSTATKATVFHLIDSVGTLTIDDTLLQAVSAPPVVDVNVPNGSLENGSTAPTGWQNNKWGTSTANFQYVTTEGHTGSKSVKVTVSNFSSGDAKWFFTPINTLTPGQQYRFTNWYKGTATPHVVALYVKADGSEQYVGMPSPLAISSTTWQKYSDTFTVPQDAVAVSVFMYVAQNGWLQTDDYSITTYHPNGFSRPLLTMTFDDGHEDNATNALPLLNQYGFKSTQCYATTFLEGQSQSVLNGALAFYNSGHEICSHTVTHPFLTTLNASNLQYELQHSKEYLESLIGAPVLNFASPYGDYNSTVNDVIDNLYRSHRTVDEGFNSKDNFDIYRLRVQNILDTTSAAQVQAWIEQAQADNTWLILVYHRVANNPGPYDSYTNVFAQHLQAIQNSGITVRTFNDALNELTAQL